MRVENRPAATSAQAKTRSRTTTLMLVLLFALVPPLVSGCEEGLLPPEGVEDAADDGFVDEGESEADEGTDPDPDNSGADSGFPHRPEGFRDLTEIGFSSVDENGWRSTDDVSVVDDPSAPRSPDAVGEIVFPEGWEGGWAPAWISKGISGADATEIYVSFWVKLSDNWQGHQVGDKIGYAWIHDDPSFFPLYVGGGSDRLHSQVRVQNVPGGARNLLPNLTDPEIVRGRWHRWEIVLVSNTGGSADGEIHWWIDGEKAGEYRDVTFGSASESKVWETVTWRPVWGGRGGVIQADQRMWMDHIYVAGR